MTAWTKGRDDMAWYKEIISDISGDVRGERRFDGDLKVTLDVSLQPTQEGASGEIACFWMAALVGVEAAGVCGRDGFECVR